MRSAPALAAVLLASFLAGCAEGGSKDTDDADTGRIDQTVLDGDDAGGTAGSSQGTTGGKADAAPGNGEIRGTVQDDAGLPVADALVSLLGTAFSATTDASGAFRFANVSSGSHGLRVVGGEVYRVHEGDVQVVAGKVTLVTVTLVPVDDRGPGYRPHLHDYWGTDTEVLLADQDYDLSKMGVYAQNYGLAGELVTGVFEPNNANWWWYLPTQDEGFDGRPPIVLPGTARLRVTLTWDDADVDVDRFVFSHTTAQEAVFKDVAGFGNGVEQTIDLKEGDADNGHQRFSLWQYRLRPEARTAPQTILGPVHLTIVLVKGDALAPEPAHEDFWNGTSELVVLPGDVVRRTKSSTWGGCANEAQNMSPEDGRLVPPGTIRLTMKLSWAARTDQANPPVAGTMRLLWKPADLPPTAPFDEYVTAQPVRSTGTSAEYDVPVPPAQTDAFYQKRSNWVFNAERTDLPDTCLHNNEAHQEWTLEVIAHKDPAFA